MCKTLWSLDRCDRRGRTLSGLTLFNPKRISAATILSLTTDPDTIYAEGGATTVWVNFPLQKSDPMPEAMLTHVR